MCSERNDHGGLLGCRPSALHGPAPPKSLAKTTLLQTTGFRGPEWRAMAFRMSPRRSHGTRAPSANRQCVHQPHALQWRPLAPRHSTCATLPQASASAAPPRCQVRRCDHGEWNVGTRQDFSCEVHGLAATRCSRCWHLRPRKQSYPSASRPYFVRDVKTQW